MSARPRLDVHTQLWPETLFMTLELVNRVIDRFLDLLQGGYEILCLSLLLTKAAYKPSLSVLLTVAIKGYAGDMLFAN